MLTRIYESFTNENIFKNKVFKSEEFVEKSSAATEIEPHRPPKELFRELVGKQEKYLEEIGGHPDFDYLDLDDKRYHYIVSVFVDIKGSTVMAAKMPLEDVRKIKNGLLVTAIDIFQVFDGHIHRLQGDAIFAYFGRVGIPKADAIIDALNATTFLQHYVKNSLSPYFEQLGFPAVKIRIGIDFGDDQQVLWTKYGIKNCSEITTTSIHTDLAAKLQSKALTNSSMIGENIKNYLDLPEEFYSVKKIQRNNESIEDRYVIDSSFIRYCMWKFEWEKYLDRFIFLERANQKYPYKSPKFFEIKCYYKTKDEKEYINEYRCNCGSLPKGYDLLFKINIHPSVKLSEIIWEVNNRGVEAQKDKLNFFMNDFKNKKYCFQSTEYKGHHYMKCTLKYQDRIIGQDFFGVYVRDNL